jgi:hypothetical protein
VESLLRRRALPFAGQRFLFIAEPFCFLRPPSGFGPGRRAGLFALLFGHHDDADHGHGDNHQRDQ